MVEIPQPPPLRHKRARKWTCEITWLDAAGKKQAWRGRQFMVEGKTLDLFPIGALCAILDRSYRTIYKWEKDYGFPLTLFPIEDDGQKKRWYSRAQLEATLRLYNGCGRLQGAENRKKLLEFTEMVTAIWLLDGIKGVE